MKIIAIVCAKDEAPRIASVLDVFVPLIPTLVVDDGSVDDTANIARAKGAYVLSLRPNRGKGQAMLEGVKWAKARGVEVVLFADADLVGFRSEHVKELLSPIVSNQFDMIVGMRDHGSRYGNAAMNQLASRLPLISGERAVRMSYLEAMPNSAWQGFGVEVAMNHAVAANGGRIGTVLLPGLSIVLKWEKEGWDRGISKMVDMGAEIVRAHEVAAQPAPIPSSFTARNASSEEVMRALARAITDAAAPFVQDNLWTSESRKEIGHTIGRKMAMPLWALTCATTMFFFGPFVASFAVIGAICNIGFKPGTERVCRRVNL